MPALLAEVIDAPGTTSDRTVRYLYGPDGTVTADVTTMTSSGTETLRWFHHDQLGSTVAITSSTGGLLGTYSYSPVGAVGSVTGTATTPIAWAGEYLDAETGFVYLRARYYDPATAQFLTRDPLEAFTRSAYGYVGNNPVNATDPLGLFCLGSLCTPSLDDVKDAAGAVVEGGARVVGGLVKISPAGVALDAASRITGHSVGLCIGGSIFGGYDLSGSVCYMATPDGRSGFTVTVGGGGGGPFGVSGIAGVSVSNARNSSDLSGTGGYGWAAGGEGPYGAGASASYSENSCGEGIWQTTVGWSPVFRVPAPFSFGGGVSHTWTPGW